MAVSKTADLGSIPSGPAFVRQIGLRRAKPAEERDGGSIMHYVYVLKCADGRPYTGCTEDLKDRLHRHNNGHVPATEQYRPVKLVAYTAFENKYKAFAHEKYLKSGSGRAFIKRHLA